MTDLGAQPLANHHGSQFVMGSERLVRRAVGHHLLPDGGVRLILPSDGQLTDAEACRLAWGLLADLAADEVVPTADVVTYREAQRLAVLRAVAAGAADYHAVADRLGWSLRVAQRRGHELISDGRLVKLSAPGGRVKLKIQVGGTDQ